MPANSYVRCLYISPEGFECENWFPCANESKLCPVHNGMTSAALAANGTNKPAWLEQRQKAQFSLLEATKDMSVDDTIKFYDTHIAGIEKIIEEQKTLVMTARALRQTEIEKLTEDQRKELRKIRTPKIEKLAKPNVAKGLGKEMAAKEKAIAGIIASRMAMGKTTTREQAIAIFEMD